MLDTVLNDREMLAAVSRILNRSEREQNPEQLIRTYVETGVLPQLQNDNNQILYGRRGTGKTHVLRVLGEEARKDPPTIVLYLDLRVLGSAHQLDDTGRSIAQRCVNLFKDFLGELHNALLDAATDPNAKPKGDALAKVKELGEAITRVAHFVSKRDVVRERTTATEAGLKVNASLAPTGPKLGVEGTDSTSATAEPSPHMRPKTSRIVAC